MTDPIRTALEKSAEALWEAESLRAAGVQRRTEWHEEGEDTRQKWRFMAAHGNAAFLRALNESGTTAIAEGNLPWLADFVLAAARDQSND
jgi:hypothetical protein